jgi:5'-3' exoribonuclease 1
MDPIEYINMGIHYFFSYFRKKYGKHISVISQRNKIKQDIDHFMIDMNGIFHTSAQKVYKYGNHKEQKKLLRKGKPKSDDVLQVMVFKDICKTIDDLVRLAKPNKTLVLCIDGPAPLAKQAQQRQRRFRSAKEKSDEEFNRFDSNCITPGTSFMDNLSKYLDGFIKRKSVRDWSGFATIFSNEKVPGEGEHKILQWVRNNKNKKDTFCMNGVDADLIMLCLGTKLPNFFLLREDMYNPRQHFFISIGNARKEIIESMRVKTNNLGDEVNDFILICFMIGNDFLPHIPSIEILHGGLDLMIETYKKIGGNLTEKRDGKIILNTSNLQLFIKELATFEQLSFTKKQANSRDYYSDPMLDSALPGYNPKDQEEKKDILPPPPYRGRRKPIPINPDVLIDMKKYRKDYYNQNFDQNVSVKEICHKYIEGMQWVLSYYLEPVPSWTWLFPYHYAPFTFDLARYLSSYKHKPFGKDKPSMPFQQLLSVLPPRSSHLIPEPLNGLLTKEDSELSPYCPDSFKVDMAGKQNEWEGIVLLPFTDFKLVRSAYDSQINDVSKRDRRRDVKGNVFLYMGVTRVIYTNQQWEPCK